MTHRLWVGGDLALYGDVGDLWGDGSGFTARDVLEALAENGPGDITVRLNSGGGLAFDGVAIYNALNAHDGKVVVSVDGIAASAASVIAMAGDEIAMGPGSHLMIHDPSAMTMGPASAHQKSAETLNALAESIASIYAKHTRKSKEEMRTMMLAETWMSAEEAVSLSFATVITDHTPQPIAAFDYTAYKHAPSEILQSAMKPFANNAAHAALTMETTTMALEPNSVVAADIQATTPAKDYTRDILDRCKAAKLSLDDSTAILDASANDPVKARDLIIDKVATRDPAPTAGHSVQIVADVRDRFREGAAKGLLARAGMSGGERNEFSGLTLRELARASLEQSGTKARFSDPLEMVQTAMRPMMASGMHSTSDFSSLLADVAHKSMMKGYDEAEETFQLWTAAGSLSDFRVHNRVDLNLFPSLAEVAEGAEYTYGTIGDRGVTISLATYGKMFSITRQAIINDDMAAFTRIPMKMGRAARRTIGNLVYAVVTANAAMADGFTLFSTDHANLAGTTGAPTVTTVDAGRAAMAKQTDPDDHATGGLNIRPAFMLVPVELQGKAQALMASEFDPAGTQRNPNYVRNIATVISDARLSTHSATAWYLAASQSMHDTIEVAYLNGVQTPTLEQQMGWDVDGMEFKVRIDAGVKALDYRGLYKNAG